MNLRLHDRALVDEDQRDFRSVLRSFIEATSPMTVVREYVSGDRSSAARSWARACRELGLAELGMPTAMGGAHGTFADQAVISFEAGRSLWPAPHLSQALSAAVLGQVDVAVFPPEFVTGSVAGEVVTALAVFEEGSEWRLDTSRTSAVLSSQGWRVNGTKTMVIDGELATNFFVLARDEVGASMFLVDRGQAEVSVLPSLDETRPMSRVTFVDAEARLIGQPGDGDRLTAVCVATAMTLLAAEQVGGAERCLEYAVDYALTREQFGRPIGQFQAVKHIIADMYVDVETSRTLLFGSLRAVAAGTESAGIAARQLKAWCSDAYFNCAKSAVQVFGGMGFTWECDLHLHLKRAEASRLLMGDPTSLYRTVGVEFARKEPS